MDINQLEYFLTCAKEGTLTKAAEKLYTTQPHVSMVVRSLEKELGVTLFARRARGVELTEDGRRIYDYAANALKNTELIFSVCRKKEGNCLRIATNPSSYMAMILTQYYQKYQEEGLLLHYTECGIEEMLLLISSQDYELGFLFVPEHKKTALFHMLERRSMEYVPLRATDLVLYVGENHPLYGRESITKEELRDLKFIQAEDDFFSVEDLLYDMPRNYRENQLLNRVVKTNSNHMMIQMLKHTALCNLGSFWLKGKYRHHNFGRIPIEGFQGKVSFGYVHRQGRVFHEQEKRFLEFLGEMISRDEFDNYKRKPNGGIVS